MNREKRMTSFYLINFLWVARRSAATQPKNSTAPSLDPKRPPRQRRIHEVGGRGGKMLTTSASQKDRQLSGLAAQLRAAGLTPEFKKAPKSKGKGKGKDSRASSADSGKRSNATSSGESGKGAGKNGKKAKAKTKAKAAAAKKIEDVTC